MKRLLLVTLIVAFFPSTSHAWNYEGHMTVVAIAYTTLTPGERQGIDAVLQSHPAYHQWQNEYQQLGPNPGATFPAYAFLRAANWPDEVRDTPYDRPTWHYVNFPLRPPNSLNTNMNIGGELLTRIQSNLARVAAQPTTNAQRIGRAIALSWILHLIGDLHQPLHTGALKNNLYPQGDRGGNLFFIKPTAQAPVLKLHSFWDGLLGRSRSVPVATAGAAMIMKKFPENSLATEMTGDYRDWATQAAKVALEFGYQFTPAGGTRMPLPGSNNPNVGPLLPEGYETTARRVAWRQVALGGYRLGNMLSDIF